MKIVKNLMLSFVPFMFVAYSAQASQVPKSENHTQKEKNHDIHNDFSIFSQGESNHWKANLVMVSTNGKEEEHLELTYKGNDAKTLGNIHYLILLPNEKLSGDTIMHSNGVLNLHGDVKIGKVPPEGFVVTTTLGWNREKETIHLHLNNSK